MYVFCVCQCCRVFVIFRNPEPGMVNMPEMHRQRLKGGWEARLREGGSVAGFLDVDLYPLSQSPLPSPLPLPQALPNQAFKFKTA
jgi:hypothetical protein